MFNIYRVRQKPLDKFKNGHWYHMDMKIDMDFENFLIYK
jgi:hypothetical protein